MIHLKSLDTKISKKYWKNISFLTFENNLEILSFQNTSANFSKDLTFLKSIIELKTLKELNLNKIVVGYQFILHLSHVLENDSNLISLSIDGLYFMFINH